MHLIKLIQSEFNSTDLSSMKSEFSKINFFSQWNSTGLNSKLFIHICPLQKLPEALNILLGPFENFSMKKFSEIRLVHLEFYKDSKILKDQDFSIFHAYHLPSQALKFLWTLNLSVNFDELLLTVFSEKRFNSFNLINFTASNWLFESLYFHSFLHGSFLNKICESFYHNPPRKTTKIPFNDSANWYNSSLIRFLHKKKTENYPIF